MKTLYLLMAQYEKTVVPLETVRQDYFPHLTMGKLLQKASRGDIALPILRIEKSQKAAKGVHIADLAAFVDERRQAALEERDELKGACLGAFIAKIPKLTNKDGSS